MSKWTGEASAILYYNNSHQTDIETYPADTCHVLTNKSVTVQSDKNQNYTHIQIKMVLEETSD